MATNRNIIYMLKRTKLRMLYSSYNNVMLFDDYSGIYPEKHYNLSTKRTSNIQDPTPRLLLGNKEIPQLFNQVVANNSCSEFWEVHGFCYKCINTGTHCLLCIISKRRQNR